MVYQINLPRFLRFLINKFFLHFKRYLFIYIVFYKRAKKLIHYGTSKQGDGCTSFESVLRYTPDFSKKITIAM